jgi:hypothetical protein
VTDGNESYFLWTFYYQKSSQAKKGTSMVYQPSPEFDDSGLKQMLRKPNPSFDFIRQDNFVLRVGFLI